MKLIVVTLFCLGFARVQSASYQMGKSEIGSEISSCLLGRRMVKTAANEDECANSCYGTTIDDVIVTGFSYSSPTCTCETAPTYTYIDDECDDSDSANTVRYNFTSPCAPLNKTLINGKCETCTNGANEAGTACACASGEYVLELKGSGVLSLSGYMLWDKLELTAIDFKGESTNLKLTYGKARRLGGGSYNRLFWFCDLQSLQVKTKPSDHDEVWNAQFTLKKRGETLVYKTGRFDAGEVWKYDCSYEENAYKEACSCSDTIDNGNTCKGMRDEWKDHCSECQ